MSVDTGRRPAGPPPPGGPSGPRSMRGPRPVRDRVSFKPIAALLLIPVILATSILTAAVLAPPFAAAGLGVNEIRSRLDALGSDFTRIPRFPERSTIYAADGSVLTRVYLHNREIVELGGISRATQRAVLAIEDSDFFQHGALDMSSLIRAIIENARAGEVVQGGSTLTQQLVGSALGQQSFDDSVEGKIQELALAIRVEQTYSKERIFELYLNQVYMGNGVYGVGTAAQFYFRKPARDLTLAEGATLAGMIRAPEYFDPIDHPDKMRVRRDDVLKRMEALGWISEERLARVREFPLRLPRTAGQAIRRFPPFFVKYLTDQIVENESGEFTSLGRTQKARTRELYEGGLEIHTTLEPDWQSWAEQEARKPLRVSITPPAGSPPPDVSIVTVDNRTGAVKVILSGRNYQEKKLDLATTGHQPGSAFKPFVLAGAFKRGIPPTQTYSSSSPWCSPAWDDEDHCVSNAEGSGVGLVDLYTATEDSINVVFAQLILDVGANVVADISEQMIGMDPTTEGLLAVPALATGSVAISPVDMAAGYQTIANDGRHCDLYTVQSIERDDEMLMEHERVCDPVLKQGDARLITSMLEAVPVSGTAASAFGGWGSWPVAGKTGTAQENTNVWFGGYTKQFTTVVWVGSPGNPYSMGSVFGGTVAAPIWVSFMSRVMQGLPAIGFPDPPKPPEGPVPSVIGLNRKNAITTLSEAGFRASVEVVDDSSPKGKVFSQTPGGGSITALGTLIQIQISTGVPAKVTMPRVVDVRGYVAAELLRSLGLVVDIVRVKTDDPQKVGYVISQDPRSKTEVVQGSTVRIFVGDEGNGGGNGDGNGGGNGGGG
ncbi:MAG: transglycosylase domain-containing protein [Actinomycetota bacterium]